MRINHATTNKTMRATLKPHPCARGQIKLNRTLETQRRMFKRAIKHGNTRLNIETRNQTLKHMVVSLMVCNAINTPINFEN